MLRLKCSATQINQAVKRHLECIDTVESFYELCKVFGYSPHIVKASCLISRELGAEVKGIIYRARIKAVMRCVTNCRKKEQG